MSRSKKGSLLTALLGYTTILLEYTIYIKSFKGENFHGFRGILLTANVLPLKFFHKYQRCPLTTQSMVPPGLKVLNHESFPYILSLSDEP